MPIILNYSNSSNNKDDWDNAENDW